MTSANEELPVAAGDVVAGKYVVGRVLGRGGMGVVVSAMHLELQQPVALKFLLPRAAAHPEAATRFAREARAAARIRSEHVARVIDVGSLPSGSPFMVMEYMEGEDLEHVLARGALPFHMAAGYILEASEAIAEAHALGIVHRDLKPANLFLARGPSGAPMIKVLDFGISKEVPGLGQASLTKTSAIMGSPRYMSPEQLRSARSVDARSDIWALGAVLYELLAGGYPFEAEIMSELVIKVLAEPHIRLASRRPDVPPGLEAVIDRCLCKEPGDRYGSIAELAVALAPFGPRGSELSVERIARVLGVSGELPPPAPLVTLPPRTDQVSPNTAAQWSESVSRTGTGRSRTPLVIASVVFGTALAVGADLYIVRARGTPSPMDTAVVPTVAAAQPTSSAASVPPVVPAAPATSSPVPSATPGSSGAASASPVPRLPPSRTMPPAAAGPRIHESHPPPALSTRPALPPPPPPAASAAKQTHDIF